MVISYSYFSPLHADSLASHSHRYHRALHVHIDLLDKHRRHLALDIENLSVGRTVRIRLDVNERPNEVFSLSTNQKEHVDTPTITNSTRFAIFSTT